MGGLATPPLFVTDREEPYRPAIALWLDTRSQLVVGTEVVAPEEAPGAVARCLEVALEAPLAGPQRRPTRLRVADPAVAEDIRALLDDPPPIRVAPTPELDQLVREMGEALSFSGDEEPSYLEGGRLDPALLGELFDVAKRLYDDAPWRFATDDQVVRVDVPALGVEGACASIMGSLGEAYGVVLFPSAEARDRFVEAASRAAAADTPHDRDLDLGTGWLALNFEEGADLPEAMRAEIETHGWPVADPAGYPVLEQRERDGASRPLTERDVRVAIACARWLGVFVLKHSEKFTGELGEPVCESYFDDDDLEVVFTIPYEAFELFEVPGAPPRPARAHEPHRAAARVGRNQPCPCGSGKKYKKCHLPLDEQARAAETANERTHASDQEWLGRLGEYAMRRFGDEWARFARDFDDFEETLQLAAPWSVYGYAVQGRPVVEWYLGERGARLSRTERSWLEAQQAAWLSVWEVTDVEPGKTVQVRDLLSGEERCVEEKSGSQTLVVRDALLGRVVDHEGTSLLCGIHPQPLPPGDAHQVVTRARGRLRRKRAVPVERLRDPSFGRYLILRWEEGVDALRRRVATPADLRNTDGHPILLTVDHFEVAPGAREEVAERLARLEGAREDESNADRVVLSLTRPGGPDGRSEGRTLLGLATLTTERLRVETNSIERADALRARIEGACDATLRHRAREHTDPTSPQARAAFEESRPGADAALEEPPPEVLAAMHELLGRYYADWLDTPVPALDGQTPREAVRTATGRSAVDVLLKDFENSERRASPRQPFDFTPLRRELGLD